MYRLAPYLAVFGVWLFLLCWETNRRYFSNFAPIIIMCGALGMETAADAAGKILAVLKTKSRYSSGAASLKQKKLKITENKLIIDTRLMRNVSFAFILVPLMVFALGFLRPVYGIIITLALAAVLFYIFRQDKGGSLEIDTRTLITILIVMPILMLVCGQCGIFAQTPDWHGRNAMLNDLINFSWPVYYDDGSAYTYYFAFALIPAMFGKLLGHGAAYFVMWLLTVLGMLLLYLYLVKLTRADTFRKQIFVLLVLMFFGNNEDLRFLAEDAALGIIRYFNPDFSEPSYILMFSPNARSFALVFHTAIPGFLGLCMFLDDKYKAENCFALGIGLIMFSPFVVLALVPIVCTELIKEFIIGKYPVKDYLKRLLSPQNCIMLALILPMLILFFVNNVMGDKPDELKFTFVNFGSNMYYYIIFVVCEFLLFFAAIFNKYKREPLFWTCMIMLMVLPFFKIGLWNDLNSRATSIFMLVVMIMCINFLFDDDKSIAAPRFKVVLCALLICASTVPVNWYLNIIKSTSDKFKNHRMEECIANDYKSYNIIGTTSNSPDIMYNYFTFDAADKFFFKYIAKPPKR